MKQRLAPPKRPPVPRWSFHVWAGILATFFVASCGAKHRPVPTARLVIPAGCVRGTRLLGPCQEEPNGKAICKLEVTFVCTEVKK